MLFVGDDWAEDHHDVEIVDEAGTLLARRRLPEGLEGVTRLHALIAEQMPRGWADLDPGEAAARVKVAIETDRGSWVAALVAAGYEVFAINPGVGGPLPRTALHLGGRSPMPRTRTCSPRSSRWTGPTIDRWPGTPTMVRRSS
jgi:hypothetical protein